MSCEHQNIQNNPEVEDKNRDHSILQTIDKSVYFCYICRSCSQQSDLITTCNPVSKEGMKMYQIEEISEQTGERFKELCLAHGVNLGDRRLEGEINRILTMIQRNARHRFLLIWTGSKVPRGAIVLGYQIVWTQNGEVLAKRADLLTGNPNTDMSIRGEQIGTYDRLLENGGKEGKDQVMIIHLSTRFT